MLKTASKILLAVYLLALLWLVLFKLSFNSATLLDHKTGLNLIPFAASTTANGGVNFRELIENCLFFVPFGLLLSVNYKRASFGQKLLPVLLFSVAVEVIQYIFGIGAADITDVITNTLGGFLGLVAYDAAKKHSEDKTLDKALILAGAAVCVLFVANIARLVLHQR